MGRVGVAFGIISALAAAAPAAMAAEPAPRDGSAVVAAAMKAMGVEDLKSVKLWGSAALYTLGQNNNANGPWPQTNLNDYVRAIDFDRPAWRAAAVTWAVPVTGGLAAKADYNQLITPERPSWDFQYAIWVTPWGFLKGAAKAGATVRPETVDGRPFQVVTWTTAQKAPSGRPYTLVGYIGPTNLVERVVTWDGQAVLGDMMLDSRYSDWRDRNGLKYPTTTVQSALGFPYFTLQTLGVEANPPDLDKLLTPSAAAPPAPPPPAQGPASEKLADGVWRIRGAYNALAVEFRDYVVLFEPGPQNEARAQAVLAETRRLIPNKPIRYGVISHHHFDHTGGLEAVVAEGIAIVTPEVNKAFLETAFSAPRTLLDDALARSGRKPVIEAFPGDLKVFDDGSQRLEIHVIKGLPHADGLVVGWLPKARILLYADMFNLPPASQPVPDPPVVGAQVFLSNLERLKIEPERILSVHTLNPDRLATMDDIRGSLGVKR